MTGAPTAAPATGWFADIGDGRGGELFPWQPFLSTRAGTFPIPVWFESEQACERFIADELMSPSARLLAG